MFIVQESDIGDPHAASSTLTNSNFTNGFKNKSRHIAHVSCSKRQTSRAHLTTRQAGSLAFQETFKKLMVKKEEEIAEREERRRRDKKVAAKSFVDL
jgi:hypothetical protein